MSVKVIVQSNPFGGEYKVESIEAGSTVLDTILKVGLNPQEDDMMIIVDDLTDFDQDYVLLEDQVITIRVIPKGDSVSTQQWVNYGLGALLVVGGVFLLPTGVGNTLVTIGASLLVGQLTNDLLQYFTPGQEVDPLKGPDPKNLSYLRGGSNLYGKGKNVPLILGRHRYYPLQVAQPYVNNNIIGGEFPILPFPIDDYTFEEGSEPIPVYGHRSQKFIQQLRQVYLLGHSEVKPVAGTYKRKDTLVEDLEGTIITEGSVQNYGNSAKNYMNLNRKLPSYNSDGYTRVWIVLPTKITDALCNFILPFFFAKNKDGVDMNPYTYFRVELYDLTEDELVSEETKAYRIRGGVGTRGNSIDPTTFKLRFDNLNPNHHYKIGFTKGIDQDQSNSEVYNEEGFVLNDVPTNIIADVQQSDLILSSILCSTTQQTVLSNNAFNKYTIISAEFTDEAKNEDGTSILTGEIDDINVIVQTHIPVYSGTGSGASEWTTIQASSNPAALFLYVLQGSPNVRPVPDSEINWASLEQWYNFCETHNYTCNMVLESPGSIESVLKGICFTGRAELLLGDTYGVVVDEPRAFPKQLITDKNSYGLSLEKTIIKDVHGYEVTFIDAGEDETEYAPSEAFRMYLSGYNADGSDGLIKATKIEKLNLVGITNATQVTEIVRYLINVIELRGEVLSTSMDWENLLAGVGDLVTVSFDELLIGLARGRLKDVVETGGIVSELTLDEEVIMEAGKSYGVTVRFATGSQQTYPVVNTEDTTQVVTFITPTPADLQVGDLYSFGETTKETGEYLIINKAPSTNFRAQITMIPYAPDVYTLTGLPPYESNLSIPGNFRQEGVLSEVYEPNTTTQQISSGIVNVANVIDPSLQYAIRTNTPAATLLRTDAMEPKLSNDSVWFVDKETLKIYSTSSVPEASRTLIVDKYVKDFYIDPDEEYLIYSDLEQGTGLFFYDLTDSTTRQLTTDAGTHPFVADGFLYYINHTNGKHLYKTDLTTSDNGSVYIEYSCKSFGIINGIITWGDTSTGSIYNKTLDSSDPTVKGNLYKEDNGNYIISTSPFLWNNTQDTVVPLYVSADEGMSYLNNRPFYGDVVQHDMNAAGDYISVDSNGNTYFVSIYGNANLDARLAAEIATSSDPVLCVSESGSNRLTNINVNDIRYFAWNDSVTGVGIPTGTTVTYVGLDYVTLSNPVEVSNVNQVVSVTGTRLVLDANKVIIPGTVQAGLLETNAMSSIERVGDYTPGSPNASEFLYSHNHQTGEEKQYNKAGDIIRQFTPDDGLWLRSGVKIGGTAPGEGTVVPENPEFTDTPGRVFRQGTPPSGQDESEGDTWYDTSTGVTYTYQSGSWLVITYTVPQLDALGIDAGTVNNFSVDKSVPSNALFTDTVNQVFRQASPPSGQGEIENDVWYETDTGSTFAYKSGVWVPTVYTPAQLDALDIDAGTINGGLTVNASVPGDALFTDTTSTLYTIPTGNPNTNPPAAEPGGFQTGDVCKVQDDGKAYAYGTVSSVTQWYQTSDVTAEYFANGGSAGFTGSNARWGVDESGKLTARGADIQGHLEADSGYFRGTLEATQGYFSGNISGASGTFGSSISLSDAVGGSFSGTTKGNHTGTASGTISGDITTATGTVGNTNSVVLRAGEVTTWDNNDNPVSTAFQVDNDGNVTMNNLTANDGTFSGNMYNYEANPDSPVNGDTRSVLEEASFKLDVYDDGFPAVSKWNSKVLIAYSTVSTTGFMFSGDDFIFYGDYVFDKPINSTFNSYTQTYGIGSGATQLIRNGYLSIAFEGAINSTSTLTLQKSINGVWTIVKSISNVSSSTHYLGDVFSTGSDVRVVSSGTGAPSGTIHINRH